MNEQNVTNYMDWLAEHWGWVGAVLAVVAKLAQDHFRIGNLEKRMQRQEESNELKIRLLAEINAKVDYIKEKVDINTENILEIHKGDKKQ